MSLFRFLHAGRPYSDASFSAARKLQLSRSRRRGLMREILAAPDATSRREILAGVSSVLRDRMAATRDASELLVYRLKLSKVPEQWENNPVERTLLLTMPIPPRQRATPRDDADTHR